MSCLQVPPHHSDTRLREVAPDPEGSEVAESWELSAKLSVFPCMLYGEGKYPDLAGAPMARGHHCVLHLPCEGVHLHSVSLPGAL